MANKPFFSIIIPAYNEEKYLTACLKSVFNQNSPKSQYEVIVVDNASTDKTPQIARKFNKVILVSEPKKGLIRARNKGLDISRGKIIINLDADCIVPKGWLKKIKKKFQNNKNLVLLTGPYLSQKGENNFIDSLSIKMVNFFYKNFNKLIAYWGGNTAVKKSALIRIGGYNLSNPYHDELSLLSKLNKIGKLTFDPALKITSSNRKIKERLFTFLFKEVLVLSFLNNIYNKLTKKHWQQWEIIRN